ncbi:MAG: BREX system ATP-binding domain-containing protein [Thermoplasmatota archaeon]
MDTSKVKDRILLHLSNYGSYRAKKLMPYKICQPGIAESINASRPHLSQEIIKLVAEGLLFEKIHRVRGMNRKRKVYFLTPEGKKVEEKTRERLEEKKINIILDEENKKVKLNDISKYINGRDPLLKALSNIENNTLNLEKKKIPSEHVFVGREKELKNLKNIVGKVKEKGAQTVFIEGEAGIGKTSLVNKIKEYAKNKNYIIASGRAFFESSDPYLPFKDVFEDISESSNVEQNDIYNLLETKGPKIDDQSSLNTQIKATFYETTKAIKNISDQKPLLFFIDDLQWADKASTHLLHYLTDNLDQSPVLLISAMRPHYFEENEGLKEIQYRMDGLTNFKKMKLDSLDWKETLETIKKLLKENDVPETFVEFIYDVSEGNPLFIKECIKQLVENDIVDPTKNRYPEKKDEIKIPKVITNIMEKRFYKFDKNTKKILQIGSVIGEEIELELLLNVVNLDKLEVYDCIDNLLETNIWFEIPNEKKYRFSHSLTHKAAYDNMPLIKRREIHKIVANNILELYSGSLENFYSDLGHHFEEGKNFDLAAKYYFKAGKHAEDMYAYEDAVEMYEKALECYEKIDYQNIYKILENLADAKGILGKFEESRNHYNEALIKFSNKTNDIKNSNFPLRMYRKIGDSWLNQGEFEKASMFIDQGLSLRKENSLEVCKLLNVKGWSLIYLGDYDKAKKIFKEELDLSKKLDDSEEISQSYHNLGSLLIRLGKYNEAIEHLEKAISMWKKNNNKKGLYKSINNLGIIYFNQGKLEKASEYYERSIELNEIVGNKRDKASSLANLGNIQYLKGKPEKALELLTECLQVFDMIGDKRSKSNMVNNIGLIQRDLGKMDKALENHKKSLDINNEIGDKIGIATSQEGIGNIFLIRGEMDKALDKINKAHVIFKEVDDLDGKAVTHSSLARLYRIDEDYNKSVEHYEKAINIRKEVEDKLDYALNLSGLGITLLKIGEKDKAYKKIRKALDITLESSSKFEEGISRRALALYYKNKKDWNKAVEEIEKAEEIFKDIKSKYYSAKTFKDKAEIYQKLNRRNKAISSIKKSYKMFNSMNIEHMKEECKILLEKLNS